MKVKNFLFSYQNILKKEIEKKKYFSFLRKILNLFLKYFLNTLKKRFSKKFKDLDKLDNKILFEKNLNSLFIHFNTDKGKIFKIKDDTVIDAHNYSLFYEKYLQKFKNKDLNFLEIGSHEGKGLASFYYYFPFAKFIGANINPFQMKFKSNRIEEVYIDVSSEKILNNFSNYLDENLDIIIDDASHNLKDIIISFSVLFKKLNRGGTYVIEDLDQFKAFKELNPYGSKELTPMQILYKIKEKKNFKSSFIREEDKKYLFENIENINIEKGSMIINDLNISDIAFIKKK